MLSGSGPASHLARTGGSRASKIGKIRGPRNGGASFSGKLDARPRHRHSGRIARWADQSGQGRDAFQKESAERPKLTQYDEAQPPLVEFDGKSLLELPAIDAPLDQGLTFFAVAGTRETPCTAFLELSNGLETQDVFFGIVAGAPQLEIEDQSFATAPVFE